MNRISTKVKSIMIPETKTIDRNGNPLIINGILAYQVRNSKRASLDVEYPHEEKREREGRGRREREGAKK
jgi:hypothetical protein